MAIGLVSTSRLIGGAVAGAIYTSIYTNHYASSIPTKLTSHVSAAGFTGSLSALLQASATNTLSAYQKVAGATPEVIKAAQMAVKESYVEGFKLVFLVAVAFGVLAVAAACCTRSVEVGKKSNERATRLENERVGVGEKVLV